MRTDGRNAEADIGNTSFDSDLLEYLEYVRESRCQHADRDAQYVIQSLTNFLPYDMVGLYRTPSVSTVTWRAIAHVPEDKLNTALRQCIVVFLVTTSNNDHD